MPSSTEILPAVPVGWKLVPIEPTEEMKVAGCDHDDPLGRLVDWQGAGVTTREVVAGVFGAMIAAAPTSADQLAVGRWLPIAQADRSICQIQDFPTVGITLRNSARYWVRDEDGRTYEASWTERNEGRSYWWDWEGESPVDPVEFMPHPLDPKYAATEADHDPA